MLDGSIDIKRKNQPFDLFGTRSKVLSLPSISLLCKGATIKQPNSCCTYHQQARSGVSAVWQEVFVRPDFILAQSAVSPNLPLDY
jgi:hypothetical protein